MSYLPLPTDLPVLSDRVIDGQHTPLLGSTLPSPQLFTVSPGIARRLYLSHFLSTWNSRVFEFGAVLYLATIYPGTLFPMSIYAFIRGFSAIVFASPTGRYVDAGHRLKVVRLSIGAFQVL